RSAATRQRSYAATALAYRPTLSSPLPSSHACIASSHASAESASRILRSPAGGGGGGGGNGGTSISGSVSLGGCGFWSRRITPILVAVRALRSSSIAAADSS